MTSLRILPAAPDRLTEWRSIHNEIVPTAVLSAAEVEERSIRHVLTVAYDGDTLVGCATVRPPEEGGSTATVIVRILPPYRRRGLGTAYLEDQLAVARKRGSRRIETVVLASNEDGLDFALARGFVEHDRYVLDGDTIPFIDLHLPE